MRSLMLFGHLDVGPGMLKSMLEFNRKETRFHVAGQKLQLLAYFYWLTRDAETVRKYEPLWRQSVELILTNREKRIGAVAERPLCGRHRHAGLFTELKRQLLARIARPGRRARGHGLQRGGEEASRRSGRLSSGDPEGSGSERTPRREAAVHSDFVAGRRRSLTTD